MKNHSTMRTRLGESPHASARALPLQTGFTLIELLVSITILAVLLLLVTNVVSVVQRTWVRSNSRVSEFREARMAFELLTRNLGQATLNSYWQNEFVIFNEKDAANQERTKAKSYARQSELQFVSGKVTGLLTTATPADSYPCHGVFFQAPLGITNLTAATGTQVNTENMVNLLCGRGYFLQWGDDSTFRPAFLNSATNVRKRFRYRLMEYNPSSEMNKIYYDSKTPRRPIAERSKEWFQDALENVPGAVVQAPGNFNLRGFTRPVAENIIALVISPQVGSKADLAKDKDPTWIAPKYEYDSTLKANPGAPAPATESQGTQHLLPPILKITMVAIDTPSAEKLAENSELRTELATKLDSLFTDATNFNTDGSAYQRDVKNLTDYLIQHDLKFRIFATAVEMKQSRWSF